MSLKFKVISYLRRNKALRNWFLKVFLPKGYYFSHKGYCVCCDSNVIFEGTDSWLRDSYLCLQCKCKPRERALMTIVEKIYPNWKELSIHESSPIDRGASVKLKKLGKNYIASQYFPSHKFGDLINGFRNEDLENQTFEDNSLDLVITQDVFEHLYEPAKAFKEIARTLKPGGAHIFTVPIINYHLKTEVWAVKDQNGLPKFLKTPEYHGNPVDSDGSPVTMHWGFDLKDYIKNVSGLETDIYHLYDKELGIMGEFNEVFVSRKV